MTLAPSERRGASIDTALVTALPAGDDGLLRLRAVQLEGFLDEVRAFEASGVESPELLALAGGFVRSMKAEGWCNDHTILAGEAPLRSMFKQMWNAFLGLDGHPQLALSLDERRALYAFYLAHPNVPASARDAIAQARRGAHDGRACEAADDAERVAVESRRLERIAQIASFDPAYPTDYAKGVVNLAVAGSGSQLRRAPCLGARPSRWAAHAPGAHVPARGTRGRAHGVSLTMRALLVDDDRELATLLRAYLAPHGVSVDHIEEGAQAVEKIAQAADAYDIVLLDVMLPGIDGFEVCRRVRAKTDLPIVMLTARGEDTDRVVGLEIGADDYLPKPFNPRELLARMRAVLRRSRTQASAGSEGRQAVGPLEVGDLVVDVPGHKAMLAGRELSLTSFEFRVLVVLARRAGETVTREELANEVLPKAGPYDPSVDRSLDVHVSHLRHKLGDVARRAAAQSRTVRGVGYVLLRPSYGSRKPTRLAGHPGG